MKKNILLILHQEHSTPGRIAHRLSERGFRLDARRPRFGDPLPETLADHDGVIMFGGPMSATDTDDYVKQETDWMEVPLTEEKPFLGICLGAQILARKLGARVDFHPKGLVEVGYYPLRATREGAKLMEWPDYIYQCHREGFGLTAGALRLAESDAFQNQAIQFGRAAFGVQFHPEHTTKMVYRWTTFGHERLALPNAKPRHEHFDGRALHDVKTRTWLDRFLDLWTGLMEPRDNTDRTKPERSLSQNAKTVAD
jgi:GMP synthase (glutamine-hydrolysing)